MSSSLPTVLISGGSDGLGKAMARRLSESYQVIIAAPNPEKNKHVAQEINVDHVTCDVSQYDDCTRSIQSVLDRYGRLDHMISNAGIWIQDELLDNDPAYIRRVLEVNTLGMIFLAKAAIPHFKQQHRGTLVFTNSQAGFSGKAGRTVYTASKFALTGFAEALQLEVAPYGIRIVNLHPGKLHTDLFEKTGHDKDMSNALEVEPLADLVKHALDLPPHVAVPQLGVQHIGYSA